MRGGKFVKILGRVVAALVALGVIGWFSIGPDWRALILYPPLGKDVLFWSQPARDASFRMFDRMPLLHAYATIEAGDTVRPLPDGPPLDLGGAVDAFFEEQRAASLVIVHEGRIRLERYGLGFSADKRWTSFSVAKSLTSSLVGAALADGSIASLEDPVSKYVSGLAGSAYDAVTVAPLLTMTSGVAWNEDYDDPESDVALFIKEEPADGVPAIVRYLARLPRAHPPGAVWNYSTGETNLVGVLISEATGKPLAEYLSEKIWKPYGMEQDASWMLASDGREIAGCCVQATTRDFARVGQFVLDGGMANGAPALAEGYLDAATTAHAPTGRPGQTGYGYQWWMLDNGGIQATGIFGQGIFIDPARQLVIASNGNWPTARGRNGERAARRAFYDAVQAAIDAETGGS